MYSPLMKSQNSSHKKFGLIQFNLDFLVVCWVNCITLVLLNLTIG